jgi:hypothetical protein
VLDCVLELAALEKTSSSLHIQDLTRTVFQPPFGLVYGRRDEPSALALRSELRRNVSLAAANRLSSSLVERVCADSRNFRSAPSGYLTPLCAAMIPPPVDKPGRRTPSPLIKRTVGLKERSVTYGTEQLSESRAPHVDSIV